MFQQIYLLSNYEIVSVINKLYWDWALKKLRDKGIGECNFKQRTDILGQA